MAIRKIWTSDEEQVIINQVRENPNNLNTAFLKASEELDRSISSIQFRWYNHIRKNNVIFMTINDSNNGYNKKEKQNMSLWKKFLTWIKLK